MDAHVALPRSVNVGGTGSSGTPLGDGTTLGSVCRQADPRARTGDATAGRWRAFDEDFDSVQP